jgi:thiamine biosynthesis lipoprotein
MNTDVTVLAPRADATSEALLAKQVAQVFAESEQIFSRFQLTSELSRLNHAGGPVTVSPALFAAFERAHHYWQITDGWFDPGIGNALCAAGYDRSFVRGLLDRETPVSPPAPEMRFGKVVVDAETQAVTLPAGMLVDFGGFVKGWTSDVAAPLLPELAALDAGGDAVLRGAGVDRHGWLVDVENPASPGRALLTIRVRDAAVATSGTNRRKWRVANSVAHHLIDPHTREPANTDLIQVTVVASSAELADVLAKTALLRGHADARRFLDRFPDVSGVFVLSDGRVRLHGQLDVDDSA